MSTVTNDEALKAVNAPGRVDWHRWMVLGYKLMALLGILLLGAVLGVNLVGWWNQRTLDRANMNAAVLILQYNLQQGRLMMPPQLQSAPASVPAPAKAPEPPNPAEAPPAKK